MFSKCIPHLQTMNQAHSVRNRMSPQLLSVAYIIKKNAGGEALDQTMGSLRKLKLILGVLKNRITKKSNGVALLLSHLQQTWWKKQIFCILLSPVTYWSGYKATAFSISKICLTDLIASLVKVYRGIQVWIVLTNDKKDLGAVQRHPLIGLYFSGSTFCC